MSWSRSLTAPIRLRDGRRLFTLADAHRFILSLPQLRRSADRWQYAAALISEAAHENNGNIEEIQAHLLRVLTADGFM